MNLLTMQISHLNTISNSIKKIQALHDKLKHSYKSQEHLAMIKPKFVHYSKKCSDEIDEGLLHIWRGFRFTKDQAIHTKSWFTNKADQFSLINRDISQYFKEQNKKIYNDDFVPPSPKHQDIVQ